MYVRGMSIRVCVLGDFFLEVYVRGMSVRVYVRGMCVMVYFGGCLLGDAC